MQVTYASFENAHLGYWTLRDNSAVAFVLIFHAREDRVSIIMAAPFRSIIMVERAMLCDSLVRLLRLGLITQNPQPTT